MAKGQLPRITIGQTTSRRVWIPQDEVDCQYLSLQIMGEGCDDKWEDNQESDYVVCIDRVGVRITSILPNLDRSGGEDDGEWRDRESEQQYQHRTRIREFYGSRDIVVREPGDYWVDVASSSSYLASGRISSFDLSITNDELYFGRPALALIAAVPIAECTMYLKDPFEVTEEFIEGKQFICPIGDGEWSVRNDPRIAAFLRSSEGLLIDVEDLGTVPGWHS